MIASKASLAAVQRVSVPWTSNASGNATVTIENTNGAILRAQFKPGTGGSQPTSGYSAVLSDEAGEDLLAGQGASLSNTATTSVCPGVRFTDGTTVSVVPTTVAETLTLTIAGAGNIKSGTLNLYFR